MPIHEYVCRNCGEKLERLQKLSDAPLTECPACGQSTLKRKVSAAGFRLAGGGWYETDFKSDGRRNIAGNKGDSSAASAASGDKKAESSSGAGKESKTDNKDSKSKAAGSS